VAHDTEFHQFMLYTPLPGTALHAEHAARGTLLAEDECPDADVHGQARFNFRHDRIPPGRETEYLLRGFESDFQVNGPSVLRIARTLLQGWRRHGRSADPRVRARFARECRGLATVYAGAAWAAERRLRDRPAARARARALGAALRREFGIRAAIAAPLIGRVVLAAMAREDRRLRAGRTYEPPTFYEANRPDELAAPGHPRPRPCRSLAPPAPPAA
jgi:hypothetical protein